MRISLVLAPLLVATALTGSAAATSTLAAGSTSDWAPAATATITPGVQTFTAGSQCTANFVFTQGARVFIGQAAHCAGTGSATDTDGCKAGTRPLGTPVTVTGASRPGTLAYSSWIAMKSAAETDPSACAFNDFALIELDPADVGKVNPSVPFFGGPTGLGAGTVLGADVYSYGNSSLRFGLSPLSPKRGKSLGDHRSGWSTTVHTVTPGVPGDSGSGFLDATGRAFGTLSTLAVAPVPASNGVSNLAKEVAYAASHGFPGLALEAGDVPFRASRVV